MTRLKWFSYSGYSNVGSKFTLAILTVRLHRALDVPRVRSDKWPTSRDVHAGFPHRFVQRFLVEYVDSVLLGECAPAV